MLSKVSGGGRYIDIATRVLSAEFYEIGLYRGKAARQLNTECKNPASGEIVLTT